MNAQRSILLGPPLLAASALALAANASALPLKVPSPLNDLRGHLPSRAVGNELQSMNKNLNLEDMNNAKAASGNVQEASYPGRPQ